jgi:hypothetical protein
LKENEELLEKGEDALTPNEKVTLTTNEEIIEGYYDSLKELDHDWRIAFVHFYREIQNQKIVTSGGGVLGVDKSSLSSLFDEANLSNDMRSDMRRRINLIEYLITEFENEYAESQRRSAQGIGKRPSFGNQSVLAPPSRRK